MIGERTLHRRPLFLCLLGMPCAVGIAVLFSDPDLDGWLVLLGLVGALGGLCTGVLAFRLVQWGRPIAAEELAVDRRLLKELMREGGNDKFSPRQVERAMRRILAARAQELQDHHEADVLFHERAHADFDIRLVEHDGEGTRTRVRLLQAKARPVPSTVRHLAAVAEREDADEAILLTTFEVFDQFIMDRKRFLHLAEPTPLKVVDIENLPAILRGKSQTLEVYLENEPPAGSPASVVAVS